MPNVMSKLCTQCVWKDQCGSPEPCSHFDPADLDNYIEIQYSKDLQLRRSRADLTAAEQDNLRLE